MRNLGGRFRKKNKGVIHVSLSWPGRYSYSPVEALDLRDLEALSCLVYSLATRIHN